MAVVDASVGSIPFPVDPGAQDTAFPDPLLTGLLEYLQVWLNYDLNAKLGNLRGSSAIAVPVGNTHAWDPTARPSATFTRGRGEGEANPLPALFVWRGKSKRARWSTMTLARQQEVKVAWIFDQLVLPEGWQDRYGVLSGADSCIERAICIGHHHLHRDDANIGLLLGLCGFGLLFEGAEQAVLSPTPSPSGQGQPKVRGYPALLATLTAWEGIGFQGSADAQTGANAPGSPGPAGAPMDLQVDIGVGDDPFDPLVIRQAIFPGPPAEGDT